MSEDAPLPIRPRRLRRETLRRMLRRTRLGISDFILPVFVCEGEGVVSPIAAMPGVNRYSVDKAADWLAGRAAEGFCAFLAFGVIEPEAKDAVGSAALDENNVVCRLVREAKRRRLPMAAMTDLCFCEYTDHGHCGVLSDSGDVDNDRTVERLVWQALAHSRAGADVVAPSGMMDGAVGQVRRGLDAAGFADVAIMAYSAKYASAFYGPFRDAAGSTPAFGDRLGYQMDVRGGVEEAIREIRLDVEQGADIVMVKPAGPYLDVIAAARRAVEVPVAAYQVSGEYAVLQAGIAAGAVDSRAITESLLAIRRAGADLVISYFDRHIVQAFGSAEGR